MRDQDANVYGFCEKELLEFRRCATIRLRESCLPGHAPMREDEELVHRWPFSAHTIWGTLPPFNKMLQQMFKGVNLLALMWRKKVPGGAAGLQKQVPPFCKRSEIKNFRLGPCAGLVRGFFTHS